LPGGLTQQVLAQRKEIEGERKQVTVMFCDLVGFASLSEKLGPEEVYSIMDEVFEILIHRVHHYGGTVNKTSGMMALFGAPIAVEEAPQRAIRAALSIHREISRLSEGIKKKKETPPLRMRIGIHTGPVVVNKLGNDLRVEFKADGNTVDMASRMEGLAEPGTTYVSEDTFKLTEGYFRFEAMVDKEVKAYRVIAPSTIRSRFDVSAERGLTPFVGREKELELLLDGFERAGSGRGQAFSLMGEAGVGKSRLLYEFRKAISHEDVNFLEGKCLSYSGGVAYHPIIDVFKSAFDISEGDRDEQVRDKVKKGLKEVSIDESSTLPYLLELLSVRDSGIDKIPMSGEARRDRMMEAWKQLMLKTSETRPLVIAIEDLHWTDRSSEDALKYLLDSLSGARILLIFTYRPEFVHTWGAKGYHSQLNLTRLSNRESLAMVTYLLGTDNIEPQVEELILGKTDGVPFFIEEMVRSLRDLGIIEKKEYTYYLTKDIGDITIPGTIQDIIMARVDSLPEAAKALLQTGSAIEREFGYELIKMVSGTDEQELLSQLSLLKDAELVYERGVYPQTSYIFRHALTREVVYDSIPDERKKRLHVDIGNAIEKIHKDSLDEYYEVLAGHYVAGEEYTKGAEYSKLAAEKAERMGLFNDVIDYGEKRVTCLEKLPRTEEIEKKIIDARTTLGLYYMHVPYLVEAKEAVEPVVDLALKLDYKKGISQIYTILGQYASHIEEDFPKAIKYLEDALTIAEEIDDTLSLLMANQWLGLNNYYMGQFDKGNKHLEKALEINKAMNNVWGICEIAGFLSSNYAEQGKVSLSYETTKEAVRMAEESGDNLSKAFAYISHGLSSYYKGSLRDAEEFLLKGISLSEIGDTSFMAPAAYRYLGDTYYDMAEYQKAEEYYTQSSLNCQDSVSVFSGVFFTALVKAKVMNNQRDINLKELFKYFEENRVKCYEGYMARNISEILLNIDEKHNEEAEEWVRKAIEADKRINDRLGLAKSYDLYAEVLKHKGDLPGAREKLQQAIDTYRECGADVRQQMAEEKLAGM
jgi:class 3 adenylate cyclase/tetratricopeptide (TPR) repeat protein